MNHERSITLGDEALDFVENEQSPEPLKNSARLSSGQLFYLPFRLQAAQ